MVEGDPAGRFRRILETCVEDLPTRSTYEYEGHHSNQEE
jgi:hypothetical protein